MKTIRLITFDDLDRFIFYMKPTVGKKQLLDQLNMYSHYYTYRRRKITYFNAQLSERIINLAAKNNYYFN